MENREEIRKAIKYLTFHCLPANESINLHKYVMMAISALEKQEQSCDTCKHGRFGSEACINCRVGFPNHYEAEAEEDNG